MVIARRPRSISPLIAALAIALIGITVVLGFALYGMGSFADCNNVVTNSTPSPDGTKAVLVFRQECNATVSDSMWAAIVLTDRPLSPDRDHAFLGIVGNAGVRASWHSNNVVEIALNLAGERIVRHEETVGDVKIDYK